MNLRLLAPNEVVVDQEVRKVVAEAENGSFCLLPRHIDYLAALVPSLLAFVDADDREHFVAIDEGMLVKAGRQVLVSTRQAIRGRDLGTLRRAVQEQFRVLDDRERSARSAVARLEADFVRRFFEVEERTL